MTKVLLTVQITLVILVVAFGFQLGRSVGSVDDGLAELRSAQAEVRAEVAKLRESAGAPGGAGRKPPATEVPAALLNGVRRTEEKVQEILNTLEWLLVDIDAIKRYTWDTVQALQSSDGQPEPETPEKYKSLFNPETKAELADLAAKKGVRLLDTRVEVPGVVIQNRAMLEFFAVVSGGKEHEAIIALTGNSDRESREIPEGLPGMINACILALGYEKGTPVRASRDGKVLPPEGEPIFVYVEWKDPETGETVRARAEDLVYNVKTMKAMERDKWVYVGSRFERDWGSGEVVYLADISGDIVATYSWPNTIIDNTTSEGSDDIYYVCFQKRIPPIGTKVTMVLSREEMESREFPPPELPADQTADTDGEERDK